MYDIIKLATASGITVVETAGNDNVNLDDPTYGSTSFPMNKADSGAIIAGGGAACGSQPNRSRWYWSPSDGSNYGKRVTVQGYGECVAAAGWNGSLTPGAPANARYTNNWAGTSSASAMVAGAAASVSSAYRFAKGTPPTPKQIRDVLVSTGTPQNTSVNPGKVGPLPNVLAAMTALGLKQDVTAPSPPTNLKAAVTSDNKVQLTWSASTDNSAVLAYQIFRNNAYYKTVTSPSYKDTNVAAATTYSYKVQAVDMVYNYGAFGSSVSVKTR
jgi:hypothetical protein